MISWLVAHGLYRDVVNASVNLVFGLIIVGFLRGFWKDLKQAWRAHLHAQSVISEQLDPRSRGGLGEFDLPLKPERPESEGSAPEGGTISTS